MKMLILAYADLHVIFGCAKYFKIYETSYFRKYPLCAVFLQWVLQPPVIGAFGATVSYLEWQLI